MTHAAHTLTAMQSTPYARWSLARCVVALAAALASGAMAQSAAAPTDAGAIGSTAQAPSASATPARPAAADVAALRIERDVVYAVREPSEAARAAGMGPVPLKLDIARPPVDEPTGQRRMCIVAIHGGGWAMGRREELAAIMNAYAAQGAVCATISYRLAPADPWPAQIMDCADAVRFLRANAERFDIDPNRIGAIGFSAGAHLAMMLAVGDEGDGLGVEPRPVAPTRGGEEVNDASAISGKVQAAVSVAGPTMLDDPGVSPQGKQILDMLVGAEPEGRGARLRAASPITYVNKGDSPMLLFQGTSDTLVPMSQAIRMAEAMTAAGVAGRVELVAGAGHDLRGQEIERTLRTAFEFLSRRLTPRLGAAARGAAANGAATTGKAEPAEPARAPSESDLAD